MNQEQLHAYLDGELTPAETARVQQALAGDPGLVAELDRLRATDKALECLPGCGAPADLAERVLAQARRGRRGRILAITVPLAAAAAALLIAILPLGGNEPPLPAGITNQDYLDYVWEADGETFGSLAMPDLQEMILEELEST